MIALHPVLLYVRYLRTGLYTYCLPNSLNHLSLTETRSDEQGSVSLSSKLPTCNYPSCQKRFGNTRTIQQRRQLYAHPPTFSIVPAHPPPSFFHLFSTSLAVVHLIVAPSFRLSPPPLPRAPHLIRAVRSYPPGCHLLIATLFLFMIFSPEDEQRAASPYQFRHVASTQ